MLQGWFDSESGRPYIGGSVYFPRFAVLRGIEFLVDTGADRSLLAAKDALRIRLDYGLLRGAVESVGVGGITINFEEPAHLLFRDPSRAMYLYRLDLEIAQPGGYDDDIPSLLGRDILDRWRMIYDPSRGRLLFSVVSSDAILPLR